MCEQLAALEQTQAADTSPAVPTPMVERRDQLQRLKALGPAFTATLVNELFNKDFRNRREVASYCGLTPSPWKSGGTDREQGISKAGNQRARHKAIEPGLALASPPGRQRAQSLVSHPHRRRRQARQTHRHRRAGAQADRGVVALPHHRPRSRAGNDQG
ncbi:transposase [Bradyrhizobium sp. USDA 4524]|uniref:transposase n=1 Tax=unclassified Bradyrhizobium TaxID=2631580 RepID=UPI0035C6A223|nr:transposase [Bradyrhizobium sp. USDA 4538]MCP1899103.1 transposase [Bradyrhizobium sp. USDA 4537]MCP1986784.1 transposase [Bradyrhizobium sp. USDA 4539]